ncbi:hypothetical protein L227DRAFT_205377 [Lentinus tigrinus ALCF2SS1-6]|uniref:Uncharacterized protein n=1 Tax=Lentinus tigrinus ALCF2SS1-6 TaxID=1328759 RepID=A0A5C2SQ45_9APHY|nr:hypothetical protein L227DRAFT_205377 [Lentinus tigrinus ALCF2SS1-6]
MIVQLPSAGQRNCRIRRARGDMARSPAAVLAIAHVANAQVHADKTTCAAAKLQAQYRMTDFPRIAPPSRAPARRCRWHLAIAACKFGPATRSCDRSGRTDAQTGSYTLLQSRAEVKVRTEYDFWLLLAEPSGSPCWGAPRLATAWRDRTLSHIDGWLVCARSGKRRTGRGGVNVNACASLRLEPPGGLCDTEDRTRHTLRARKPRPKRKSRSYRKRVNTNYCLGQLLASRSEPAEGSCRQTFQQKHPGSGLEDGTTADRELCVPCVCLIARLKLKLKNLQDCAHSEVSAKGPTRSSSRRRAERTRGPGWTPSIHVFTIAKRR